MVESYFVVEGWSDDPDGLCQVFFVQSKLSRDLLVRLLAFASPLKELRVLCLVSVTDQGPAVAKVRPGRYFVRLARLLDPKVFLDDVTGALWSLLCRAEAEGLVHDWMDDPHYAEGATSTQLRSEAYYYKNRVDAFASKVEDRWPNEVVKARKRG